MITDQQKADRRKWGGSSEIAAVWHLLNCDNSDEKRIDPHKDGRDVYWNKVVRLLMPDGTTAQMLPYARAVEFCDENKGWTWEALDKDKPLTDQMMEGILLEPSYGQIAEYYTGLKFESHRMFVHPSAPMAANTDFVHLDTVAGVFDIVEAKRIGDPRILVGYGSSRGYDNVHNCHWLQVHHQAEVVEAETKLKPRGLYLLADRLIPKSCQTDAGLGIGLYKIKPERDVQNNIVRTWREFFDRYVNRLVAPEPIVKTNKGMEQVAA